jgi:hypothetical protein
MSLVFARKNDRYICLVSDSLVEYQNSGLGIHFPQRDRNIYRAEKVLKAVILGPDTVACWAGEIEFADRFFQQLWAGSLNPQVSLVHDLAKEMSRQSGGETDFIVATRQGGLNLSKFVDGNMEDSGGACFTGSDRAVDQFLKLEASTRKQFAEDHASVRIVCTSAPDDIDNTALGPMATTMARLIEDNTVPEVGGFVIPVRYSESGFHYSNFIDLDAPYRPPHGNDWEMVDLGSVETGAYAYQCLELDQDGLRVPVIHFVQEHSVLAFEDRSKGAPRTIHFPANSSFAQSVRSALPSTEG